MRRVAVLGAGGWGTALAVHLGRIGHDVSLWARDAALAADVASRRVNGGYLPGIHLPDNVAVTSALDAARTAVGIWCATSMAKLGPDRTTTARPAPSS